MLDDEPGQDAEDETDGRVQPRNTPQIIHLVPNHGLGGISRMKEKEHDRK
jgi:hypothetical protein